jgi:hypothetical protein
MLLVALGDVDPVVDICMSLVDLPAAATGQGSFYDTEQNISAWKNIEQI